MAQFVFSLEGVLRHRLRLEEAAQRSLADRLSEADRLRRQLDHLNGELAAATARLRDGLSGVIDGSYLAAHRRYACDAAQRAGELMGRLANAQQAADEAQAVLSAAARERRVVELLRETHFARWKAQQLRKDHSEADEVQTQMTFAGSEMQTGSGPQAGRGLDSAG